MLPDGNMFVLNFLYFIRIVSTQRTFQVGHVLQWNAMKCKGKQYRPEYDARGVDMNLPMCSNKCNYKKCLRWTAENTAYLGRVSQPNTMASIAAFRKNQREFLVNNVTFVAGCFCFFIELVKNMNFQKD